MSLYTTMVLGVNMTLTFVIRSTLFFAYNIWWPGRALPSTSEGRCGVLVRVNCQLIDSLMSFDRQSVDG